MNLSPRTFGIVGEEKWMMKRKMKSEIRDARLAKRGYLRWTEECTGSDLTGESFCDIV